MREVYRKLVDWKEKVFGPFHCEEICLFMVAHLAYAFSFHMSIIELL